MHDPRAHRAAADHRGMFHLRGLSVDVLGGPLLAPWRRKNSRIRFRHASVIDQLASAWRSASNPAAVPWS